MKQISVNAALCNKLSPRLNWRALNHRRQLWIIFTLATALFAFIVMLDNRISGSDDTVFISQTAAYPTITDWVSARYQLWSGRVAGEGIIYIFSNLPIIFWQIVTIGMYALSSILIFFYYRLLMPVKQHAKADLFALIAALSLPYLLDKSVFSEGILWVTGSMVYYWSFTLMLLALYTPIACLFRRNRPNWWKMAISLLSTIVVPLSSEQAGVVLVVCLLCACATLLYKRSSFFVHGAILLFTAVISLLISLRAPGNLTRLRSETTTWLPDFYTAPLPGHINDALRWILEALINHTGLVFILLWLCLAGLLLARKKRSLIDNLLFTLLVSVSVLSLARGFDALRPWTNFHAAWHAGTFTLGNTALLGGWVLVLFATPIAVIRALPDTSKRLVVLLLILCSYGTTLMMALTPTMYASAWRSILVPSMLLGLAAFIVALVLWQVSRQNQRYIICVAIVYCVSHYIFQLSRMIAQK